MAVTFRERVQTLLGQTGKDEEEARVHKAIDQVAGDIDSISRRLALIDPEWELLARQTIDERQC